MAYHTYEFLKRRKNDPKWRKAYTSARNKRIIGTLVTINIIIWGFVLWKKIESGDIENQRIFKLKESKKSLEKIICDFS